MKQMLVKALDSWQKNRRYKFYTAQFKALCKRHGIPNKPIKGEEAYLKLWSSFSPHVEVYSYRLFCKYMGEDPYIIPEDIGHSYLEDTLNPRRYRDYYTDKNLFDEFFVDGTLPTTIYRRMNGSCLLDKDYRPVVNFDLKLPNRVILKPSVDSDSGRGVMLFEREGETYVSKRDDTILTREFLMSYGNDIILQEAIEQHPALSRFNRTSVNTLRLATYRSVKTEKVHVVASIIRIGAAGEICDNGHRGGKFVSIDLKSGELGKYACDQYGNISDTWNDINFKENSYCIPNWDKVIEFAQYIGSKVHKCRLLALDVSLDLQGTPRLIEFNPDAFGFWLFMFSGQRPLGAYSDEIIQYCKTNKNKELTLRIY